MRASHVHDYRYGEADEFLFSSNYITGWTISSTPFRLAEPFPPSAPGRAREGVALLVLTAFLKGSGRFVNLFSEYGPNAALQFSERVPMHKGRLVETGSTATAYCWIVWFGGVSADRTYFGWIPPWRRKLETPEHYRALAPDEVAA